MFSLLLHCGFGTYEDKSAGHHLVARSFLFSNVVHNQSPSIGCFAMAVHIRHAFIFLPFYTPNKAYRNVSPSTPLFTTRYDLVAYKTGLVGDRRDGGAQVELGASCIRLACPIGTYQRGERMNCASAYQAPQWPVYVVVRSHGGVALRTPEIITQSTVGYHRRSRQYIPS